MALIDRIHDLNRSLPGKRYYRLWVNGQALGDIDTQLLPDLDSDLFVINEKSKRIDIVFPVEARSQFEKRIEAFFARYFQAKQLNGRRGEYYAVASRFQGQVHFLLEREALSLLGLRGYGVHISGYVRKNNTIHMWIAKRAAHKTASPGKFDQIAAGGLPYHLSPMANVIKECKEEASIPEPLASQAIPVSALSYRYDLPIGLRPDVIFNYDLLLPDDFTPCINDGEVAAFELVAIDDILRCIADSTDFKFNSAAVIIDFAIRHGVITPEHPDYIELQSGLRV